MKFDCDSRRERREANRKAREAALREWHPFFAILPVRIAHGDCRFLETVERRFVDNNVGEIIDPLGLLSWTEIEIEYRELTKK